MQTAQRSFSIGGVRISVDQVSGVSEINRVKTIILRNGMKVAATEEEHSHLQKMLKSYADEILKRDKKK